MDEEAPPEVVTVEAISVDPNNCALDCELNIAMSFTALQSLPQARWEIRFIADQAHKRKIVELGSTPTQDYPVGEHSMNFSVPEVSVAHLSRHVLANVGLLLVVLYSGETEVLQVSMVTQVTPQDDVLIRSIFNPLE